MWTPSRILLLAVPLCIHLLVGCSTPRGRAPAPRFSVVEAHRLDKTQASVDSEASSHASLIRPVVFRENQEPGQATPLEQSAGDGESAKSDEEIARPSLPAARSDLSALIATAIDQNPRLIRLYREYEVAAARSRYVDKLPDPRLGANIFGDPIETAAGSQRANMSLSQTIPWLGRLNAQQQQACLEAFAIRAEYAAEQLRVVAGIRTGWYRLYVIDKQVEITEANQQLLESLIDVANARVATGNASQGDVLLGTLELAKLEERLLIYRKQRRAAEAEINRLVGRPAAHPIPSSGYAPDGVIDLDVATIHQIALRSQPEIEAARLRTQATRWGIEVARLSRRPEFMLSASYFFTDDNRPATSVVHVGEDPWGIGFQMSIPIWRQEYDAMQNEACRKHQAAHASVTELADRYDALILDLMTEAQRANETAKLYKTTILPQARQTLSVDQKSYSNGNVEFDRVIQDYRNLLTLELGSHQAIGELAIANARIQQVAGRDLPVSDAAKPSSEP